MFKHCHRSSKAPKLLIKHCNLQGQFKARWSALLPEHVCPGWQAQSKGNAVMLL
jgi:hypothetical protein